MQIHELNTFDGNLNSSVYLAVDDGSDTGKISVADLTDPLNARIDNIIAGGSAPSAAEVTDARLGINGVPYPSLGSAIRTQVEALDDRLNLLSYGINLFNPDNATRGQMIVDGSTTADANCFISDYFPCSANEKFSVNYAPYLGNGQIYLYDEDYTYLGKGSSTNDGRKLVYTAGGSTLIKYARINGYLPQIEQFMIISGTTLPDDYVPFGVGVLNENALLPKAYRPLPGLFEQSNNLFDKDSDLYQGYFSGSFQTSASYRMTPPILIEPGVNYVYPHGSGLGTNYTVPIVDSDGNYSGGFRTGSYSNGLVTFSVLGTTKVYVMLNIGLVAGVSGFFLCKESDYNNEFEPFGYKLGRKVFPGDNFNYPLLVGKKASFNGDSICYGNGYIGGYGKIITDENAMLYENIAVGGATIAAGTYSGETARHWISRTIENMAAGSDFVIIEGGVNDAALNVPLGSITSNMSGTLDDTTFYGALESIFKQLTIRFTGKKVGFIIPHQMVGGMLPGREYYQAIIDCCTKWGIPLLDLSIDVPPFGLFPQSGDSELVTIRDNNTTSGDGWHPTESCYRNYYVPKIAAWMNTL